MSAAGGMNWKNPIELESWRSGRRKRLEQFWGRQGEPKLFGADPGAGADPALEYRGDPRILRLISFARMHRELDRDRELEAEMPSKPAAGSAARSYTVPDLIGRACGICGKHFEEGKCSCAHGAGAGEIVLAPHTHRADPRKIRKATRMYDAGLEHKAQRELACGLLGAEVKCRNGHTFRERYECGNRYCTYCGPKEANELFARTLGKIRLAAAKLLDCGEPNCRFCEVWRSAPGRTKDRAGKAFEIPHWPPPEGARRRPRVVIAALDFTIVNDRKMPEPDRLKQFNGWIKKFFRTIERRFGIARSEYGNIFCDELGRNNTNIHAHSIYVGPWLPQERREISKIWEEVTRGAGRIVSIKYARSIEQALYHAIKYPAKFAEIAQPDRLADLEKIFHRVRRVHALASFYNCPEPEEDEESGIDHKCPACGEALSQPNWWCMISDLIDRGVRDLVELKQEIGKKKVLLGWGNASP